MLHMVIPWQTFVNYNTKMFTFVDTSKLGPINMNINVLIVNPTYSLLRTQNKKFSFTYIETQFVTHKPIRYFFQVGIEGRI